MNDAVKMAKEALTDIRTSIERDGQTIIAKDAEIARLREALEKALDLSVLTLAFIERDRGTDRLDRTLDGLQDLAREANPILRAALSSAKHGEEG